MKVKFWGCRGSIPASYTSEHERVKLKSVLETAIEAKLGNKNEIDDFIEKEKLDSKLMIDFIMLYLLEKAFPCRQD